MTVVPAPAKILLTGANGYVAVYAAKDLLEKGYSVVGTVRSASKGDELVKLFSQYGDKFSYALVPDIAKPGAFDQVIKEGKYDGVAHAASPVNVPGGSFDDFVKPAVSGAVNILESIKEHGPTVKRVIVTASFVSMLQYAMVQHNETHWNEKIFEMIKSKGDQVSPMELYAASKTLAEKAVWEFVEKNKGSLGFDLATINPSYILGAPIHPVTSRSQLTSTNNVLESASQPHPESELANFAHFFVNVKDVAAIHTALFSRPDAGGHRVITVGGGASWQDIYDILNEEPAFPNVPKGNPGVGRNPDSGTAAWDTSYGKELLGRDFIGAKETFRDTEAYYRQKGWSFFKN